MLPVKAVSQKALVFKVICNMFKTLSASSGAAVQMITSPVFKASFPTKGYSLINSNEKK